MRVICSQNQEATVHGIRSYIPFYFADVTLRREMPFTSMPVLNPIGIRRIHWSDHSFAVYVCIQTSFCSARLSTMGLHVDYKRLLPQPTWHRGFNVTSAKVSNMSRVIDIWRFSYLPSCYHQIGLLSWAFLH